MRRFDDANAAVTAKQGEITKLNAYATTLAGQLTTIKRRHRRAEAEVIALQAKVSPLLAALALANDTVSATEAEMKALQLKSVDLDKQVTAAQGKLRTLRR